MIELRHVVHAYYAGSRGTGIMVAGAGVVALLFAAYLVAKGQLGSSDGPTMVAGVAVVGAALTAAGVWWWRRRRIPYATPLYRNLAERRHSIVWIYGGRYHAGGRSSYCLWTEDRKLVRLPVQWPGLAQFRDEQVLDCLAREFRSATVGYSDEHAARFRADPGSFRCA